MQLCIGGVLNMCWGLPSGDRTAGYGPRVLEHVRAPLFMHACVDELLKFPFLVRIPVLWDPVQQCVLAPAPPGKSWNVCGEVSSVMVTAAAAPYISNNVAMWVLGGPWAGMDASCNTEMHERRGTVRVRRFAHKLLWC